MASSSVFRNVSESGMSNLRNLLGVSDKEKLPPELKRALDLLGLADLKALEERFLALEAFLKPWAVFRDSTLYLFPDAVSSCTIINTSAAENGITRSDIMSFYTRYDEDVLRHDPRDAYANTVIDKRTWRVEEYEKHLYVWLIQAFKVGKRHNPWQFTYFELRSTCAAWVDVFVPIINAVRASYDVKGRRHYGRLALFIEERCPSGLAFPAGNIESAGAMSSILGHVRSDTKRQTNDDSSSSVYPEDQRQVLLTKKHYDETEKELREVYPQFGGLIEKPIFKKKMEDWLDEQRARVVKRMNEEQHKLVPGQEGLAEDTHEKHNPVKKLQGPFHRGRTSESLDRPASGVERSTSIIRRCSDSVRRSLSLSSPRKNTNMDDEPKSPFHGVTRPMQFPNDAENPVEPALGWASAVPSSRPEVGTSHSEKSLYRSIRNSNPFTGNFAKKLQQTLAPIKDTEAPNSHLAHIASSYNAQPVHRHQAFRHEKSRFDNRSPSYEGTGYQHEISLEDLDHDRKEAARSPAPPVPAQCLARLSATSSYRGSKGKQPAVFGSAPRDLQLEHDIVSSNDGILPQFLQQNMSSTGLSQPLSTQDRQSTSKSVLHEWGDAEPPRAIPWPGFESDDEDEMAIKPFPKPKFDENAPPAPSKSTQRRKAPQARGLGPARRLAQEETAVVHRIISKENIRLALSDPSRESLMEDSSLPTPVAAPLHTLSPPGSWQTYNKHMFPRTEKNPE